MESTLAVLDLTAHQTITKAWRVCNERIRDPKVPAVRRSMMATLKRMMERKREDA
jgi:hypothetical protein